MVFDLLDLMLSNLRLDLIAGDLISEMGLYWSISTPTSRLHMVKALLIYLIALFLANS